MSGPCACTCRLIEIASRNVGLIDIFRRLLVIHRGVALASVEAAIGSFLLFLALFFLKQNLCLAFTAGLLRG
jgi:hypothetical protein